MSAPGIERTRDAAKGRWKGTLERLGIEPGFLRNIHGPCPICKGKDRYRFDDHDGDGTWYCNQCGAGSGIRLLMEVRGWDFARAAKAVDDVLGVVPLEPQRAEPKPDKRGIMIQLWKASQLVTPGDPVWRYLESRCGDPGPYLQDIRFHPALKHSVSGGTHPGMLALLRPNQGKAIGVHRTFLTPDGRKAAVDPVRMTFGEVAQAQLGPVAERMGIAEGIETAICASKLFGVPVWSAICANGLKAWEPPDGVKTVIVCGDNDRTYTGQDAAYSLAHRLVRKGYGVEVQIPETVGTDWADVNQTRAA